MDLNTIIRSLSRPEAYPHPVEGVRVVQTHASCVFLTGDYAYKVKKPVDFGFLDYSTLERREHYCREELRLNRRFCPQVYLDVLPITQSGGEVRVGGTELPVEWALRMVQIPEEDLLSRRLAAARVDRPDVCRVADSIVRIHREAPSSPEIRQSGSIEAITRNVEENFEQTTGRVGSALPAEHLEVIRAFTESALRDGREMFAARVDGGWVRDGHGDLRAQNICLYPGLGNGVQILDCIEFAERFRWGDVAADVAYLAMDLDLAGRADLRRALVETYQELTQNAALDTVLPFYVCYRAYVRGKIALLAAEAAEIPTEQRGEHLGIAAAAFDLARSYAQRPPKPRVLLMCGYSGSGKSVLGRELARRLGAVRISSDEVRKKRTAEGPDYSAEGRRRIYTRLYEQAEALLAVRETVILDATFLDPEERAQAASAARKAGGEPWLVCCHCSDEVIRRRLTARARQGADVSDAGLAVYEAQRRDYPALVQSLDHRTLIVDTGAPVEQSVRRTLEPLWRAAQTGSTEVLTERFAPYNGAGF